MKVGVEIYYHIRYLIRCDDDIDQDAADEISKGTDGALTRELQEMSEKHRELSQRKSEMKMAVETTREEIDCLKESYEYLEKTYDDAEVRSALESLEAICDGMDSERAAVQAMSKYEILDEHFTCSM